MMPKYLMTMFQAQSASTEAERYLLIYFILIIALVFGLFILFFVVFQKRKNKLLFEKFEQQRRFDEALVTTQQEIHLHWVGSDGVRELAPVSNVSTACRHNQ